MTASMSGAEADPLEDELHDRLILVAPVALARDPVVPAAHLPTR
jgi:hypothetical protein